MSNTIEALDFGHVKHAERRTLFSVPLWAANVIIGRLHDNARVHYLQMSVDERREARTQVRIAVRRLEAIESAMNALEQTYTT